MNDDNRLYSFVAGLYLSPLQCGLQTAHTVSEMYADYNNAPDAGPADPAMVGRRRRRLAFDDWARHSPTIIILNALNSKGVLEAYEQLKLYGDIFSLPITLFREDEASLNGAPTATAIVVPRRFYDVKFNMESLHPVAEGAHYLLEETDGTTVKYSEGSQEFAFISFLKSYRLV